MSDPFTSPWWPTELISHSADKTIEIRWDDGRTDILAAEYLRVESPSAEVRGHGPGQKMLVAGRRHVAIMKIEPVGHYAVRLVFDDLHDSGIYSWRYLRELADEREARSAEYVSALDAQGKRREP